MVDLAHVAGLDEQTDLGAGLLADEVVVDGGREQQRRDGREVATGVAVGEHDERARRAVMACDTSAKISSRRSRMAAAPPVTS